MTSQVKLHHFSIKNNNGAVLYVISHLSYVWSNTEIIDFLVFQIFGNVESKKKYIVDTFDGQCIPPKWLIQNDRNSFEPNVPFGRLEPSDCP